MPDNLIPEDLARYVLGLVPAAPFTWCADTTLSRTVDQTGKIKIDFGRPVVLVGAFAEVSRATAIGGALLVATAADFDVCLEVDKGARFTSTDTIAGAVNPSATFAPLRAVESLAMNRFLNMRLDYSAPSVSVQFRWRRLPAGGPWFEDARITLAFFGDYINAR